MLCRIEAANYVRFTWGMPLSPNTLAKLAVIGGGPIFRKVGKFPLYEAVDLDRWVLARLGQKRRSTSDVPDPTSPYANPDPPKGKDDD
jgi:hypothetical protein